MPPYHAGTGDADDFALFPMTLIVGLVILSILSWGIPWSLTGSDSAGSVVCSWSRSGSWIPEGRTACGTTFQVYQYIDFRETVHLRTFESLYAIQCID